MSTPSELRERLAELDPNAMLLDGPLSAAIVGIGRQFNRHFAVYSLKRCVEILVEDGLDEEGALEHLEFNTLGAYVGPGTPIFLLDL